MHKSIRNCLALGFSTICAACGGESADQLASSLDAAFKAGDMDAALALLDSKGVPAMAMSVYMDNVNDCFAGYTCTVSMEPLSDAFKKEIPVQREKNGVEFSTTPEGIIKIAEVAPESKGTVELPYAKVDGKYKIIGMHYTAEKLAALKTKTAQSITDELLAKGIGDPPDTQWKSNATALPADGGDAGNAFVAKVKATAAAAKANDVDAMIAAGGDWEKMLFGEKDLSGKPVSLKARQLKMRTHFVLQPAEVTVTGGYRLDDMVVVTFDGHDGNGWVVHGAQLMQLTNGAWQESGRQKVSIPPA
jgi:hypothetical protein